MLSVTARLVLFTSSYAPLLALFAILDSFGRGWPSQACAAVAALSILALVVTWRLLGSAAGDWVTLSSARNRDTDVMAFFVSYVVPFAAAQDANGKTRIGLAVFAVIIAALYVRSAVFYVHPLLLLAGYHIVEATTNTEMPIIVITRKPYLQQSARLWTVPIASAVRLERRHQ